MLSEPIVNRRTHSLWTIVLMATPLAVLATGCIVVDDDDGYYDDGYDDDGYVDPGPDVESVGIDAGETLDDIYPGEGAGVFVEYLGFGEWRIQATCDTDLSGYACLYDVYISADGLSYITEDGLESGDFIDENIESVHVGFDTDYDIDGVYFSTFEDAPALIEVWLDGSPDSRYTFWIENGDVWSGMPTNPTFFVP